MQDDVIDRLSLEVNSDSSNAVEGLDLLCRKLDSLNESVSRFSTSGISSYSRGVEKISGAINSFNSIDTDKFSKVITMVDQLSKIDLENKKIEIDIQIPNDIDKKLGKIDIGNIPNVADSMRKISESINAMGNIDFKKTGINSVINSLRRLSIALQTDFNTAQLRELINSLNGINSIPDVSNSVNRFISSIARVSNAGDKIKTSANGLPELADSLKEAASSFSDINISEGSNRFIQSISQLSNSGDRLNKTAKNLKELGVELKNFFQTMKSAPRISNNTIRMTEALAKLSNAGGKAGSAARRIRQGINDISGSALKGRNGLRGFNSALSDTNKKAKNTALSIAGLAAKFWILKNALQKLWSPVENSMNFLETFNYFESAFNQVAEKAQDTWSDAGYNSAEGYANSFSKRARELTSKMSGYDISKSGILSENKTGKTLGMDAGMLLNYQATFAQISSSIGTTSEQALKLSNALTMIGADLASVKNEDFQKVYENLSSGLVGMSRAVDKYGANIRNANLQQKAQSLGIQESVAKMSQSDKALLRTIIILDSTRYAWADMAKTINLPANQLRIFRQNIISVARAIGNIFLPVVAKVLPYINGMVIAVKRLIDFIGGLLGINTKIKDLTSGIGGGGEVISNALDSLENTDISDLGSDASKNLGDAAENAKKLNKWLSSYDELEVMNQKDDFSLPNVGSIDSEGALSGLSDYSDILNSALDDILSEYQKKWDEAYNSMDNKAMEFADKIEKTFKKLAKAAEPTTRAMVKLWNNGLKKFRNFTWTGLKDFWEYFLVPLGKWTLGEKGLPRLINAFDKFLMDIHWDKINDALVNLWDALEPFAENVGTGLINFFEDLLEKSSDLVNKLPDGINAIAEFIKGIEPETAQKIGYGIGQLITAFAGFKALKKIGGILNSIGIGKFLSSISRHPLITIAGGITATALALDQFGVIDIDWDKIKAGISGIKDEVIKFIKKIDWQTLYDALENIISVLGEIASGFLERSADIINVLAKAFGFLAEKLANLDPETLKGIGKGLAVIATVKISTDLIKKITGLANAFGFLGRVFSGKGMKSLLNGGGILESLKGPTKVAGLFGAAVAASEASSVTIGRDDSSTYNKLKQFSANMTEVLQVLNENGKITDKTMLSFSKTLQTFDERTDYNKALEWLAKALENVGVSADDVSKATALSGNYLGNFINKMGGASKSVEEYKDSMDKINPNVLIQKMGSIQDSVDRVNFANLIIDSSNSIDKMGGIWENGKQILGEDAIAIHEEIKKGLSPDENGFYTLANGQMVQYGKGIEGYEKNLKDIAKSTLDRSLLVGMEELMPEGYSIGYNTMGYFIDGVMGSSLIRKPEIQEAFDNTIKAIQSTKMGYELASDMSKGIRKGFLDTTDSVGKATDNMMEEGVKKKAKDSVESHSPSKWFERLAIYCGKGFVNGLAPGFNPAFSYFSLLGRRISNYIGDLSYIGRNIINGINNGMVSASYLLMHNVRTIASNITRTFKNVLDIHSPSKVFEQLGRFTMQGFYIGMNETLRDVELLFSKVSIDAQKIPESMKNLEINQSPVPTLAGSRAYQGNTYTGNFGDDIRREIIAISSNTFQNNQNVGSAVREALNGMAVYAGDKIIGYLKEEDQEYRNRNGFGLFEGV